MSTIVQSKRAVVAVSGASPYISAISLDTAPNPAAFCLTCWSGNKQVPSVTTPPGWTAAGTYTGPSVTGRSATATGLQTASWQWTGTVDTHNFGAIGIYETDILNATVEQIVTVPNPANDAAVSTITADLGVVPAGAAGAVFAIVGPDSSYDLTGASTWPAGSTITWSNSYEHLDKVQQNSSTAPTNPAVNANGVAYILGKKDVNPGDTTAVTVSWSGGSPVAASPDQVYLTLIRVSAAPTPIVSAGADVASHTATTVFTRTATENLNGGGAITARAWTIVSGPTGAGTTIGTSAALSWAPTTAGTYVLRYSATNAQGTGSDDMQIVVAAPAGGTLTSAWLGVDAIKLRLSGGSGTVRVAFSTSSGMTSPTYSSAVTPDSLGNAHVPLPALTPSTTYYYQAERAGVLIGIAQQFDTLPTSGSFAFAFSSCRDHTADSPIMADIPVRGADLFLEIGDFHYRDINTNTPDSFRTGYDELHTRANIAAVLQSIPTAYVYDDHDYGPNASNKDSASRPAATSVYRERVPHVTLPATDGGIYHTFKIGRARFIMLDCRAYRSPVGNTDNSSKTMLGTAQKAWLQGLLASPDTPLTFVISPVGWHSAGSDDDWGFYQNERTQLAANITASSTEVVMLCGDMHRMAIAGPANGAPGGVHVWHAAPLQRNDNGVKGGPYAADFPTGTYSGTISQYGFVNVVDTGATITATFSAIKSDATVAFTDSVTVVTALDDTAAGIDTAATLRITDLTDTASGSDTVALSGVAELADSDSALGSDTVDLATYIGVAAEDTAAGSDAVAVTVFHVLADQGEGLDSTLLLRSSELLDPGVGAELMSVGPGVDDTGVGSDLVTVLDIPYTQVLEFRPGPTYELVMAARIPQTTGPPLLLEVDPIEWSSLKYTNELSRPQQLEATCLISTVPDSVLQRLRQPHNLATELWLLREGKKVFAGPLQGWRVQGEQLSLTAHGLLAYLRLMVVTADLVFSQVDQFQIVKAMIDQWQGLEFGNFGIDTSLVAASGQLRDGTYLRDELHGVAQRVEELGRRINGFDIEVDPASRQLQLWNPQKGIDRSEGEDAVVFDERNITSSSVMCSVAPGDLASDVFGTGTSSGESTLYSTLGNAQLRARFGRSAITGTWDSVSEQSTLDAHAQGMLDARDEALLIPGPDVRVTPDADLNAYSVGDTVSYELHERLGVSGAFRIRRQSIAVSSTGQESATLEFA